MAFTARILKLLCGRAALRGHRDLATMSWPGYNLYVRIADGTLADDVTARATDEYRVVSVCGSEGQTLVAEIEAGN
jgi:hypothetical protein